MLLAGAVALVLMSVAPKAASPEPALYKMSSRDQGITGFDVSVTETKREERTSVLRVSGFHDRPAAASRWLMCADTDLAMKRGFAFWAVLYPTPPSEELVLGFPKSEKKDDVSERHSQLIRRVMPTPEGMSR
jgi:hypothetical protein